MITAKRLHSRWALLLVAVLAACDGTRTRPASISVTDSAGVRITRITADPVSLDEWTLASAPRTVMTGEESGDSSAFSPIGAARWLPGGAVVISDIGSKRLLVYDSVGVFQRALGREGDGPGEFRRLGALSHAGGDTVAMFDRTHRRLSYWHVQSGYIRSVDVSAGASLDAWPDDAWAWGDSLIVVPQLSSTTMESIPPGPGLRKWPMYAQLTVRDRAGGTVGSSSRFDAMYTGLYDKGDMRVVFSNNPFAAVARDRVYFGSGMEFRVSILGAPFTKVGEWQWDALQEPITSDEVQAVRAERQAIIASQLPPERMQRVLDMEFAPELLPPMRPAIGRVLVDADQRVWLERFEPIRLGTPVQTPGAIWHVIAADGRPLARLRLPARTRLEDIRGGQLLVMQRDSLDIETIALYPLVRPSTR
jgi:hypothetical protein